jgi:hypothetical protein
MPNAAYHPGGAPGTLGSPGIFGGPGASEFGGLGDPIGQAFPSKPCGPTVDTAINTIDAGFLIDLTTGGNDGFYVRQARASFKRASAASWRMEGLWSEAYPTAGVLEFRA